MDRRGLAWAGAAALCLAGASFLSSRVPPALPSLRTVRIEASGAMEDLAFVALGMRRQAADIHFIRLLQYYGTPDEHEHEGEGAGPHLESGGGDYPELYPRALRLLELDPYFRYGVIYAAGALAFNLDRADEAVALMEKGLERDPKAWQYRLYIASIAYKRSSEYGRLVDALAPALKDPECPAMLKSIAAGVYARLGRKTEAAALYRDIEDNSKDPYFQRIARDRRERLESGR